MYQTTFSLISKNNDEFNDFIESSSNALAYKHIQDWQNNFGIMPYIKTLIIKAPKASGKTMLANLWIKKTNALIIKKNYELTSSILERHECFVIDGFDNNWNEEDVLHYFNILHENGKHFLITLTKMPKIKLADLSSRLNSANLVNVDIIDDGLMKVLIFKQFSNFSIIVNNDVINYLLKVLPREFPQILNSVAFLNQLSLEQKRKITVPFVKENLDRINANLR